MAVSARGRRPLQGAAVALVVRALRASLAGDADPGTASSLPPQGLDEVVRAVRLHRVASILVGAGDRSGLPAHLLARLRPLAMHEAQRGLLLADQTGRAHLVLEAAGVRAVAFKGAALAVQLAAGHGAARGGGDVDVLVEPASLAAADRALAANGWLPAPDLSPAPGPGAAWRWTELAQHQKAYTADSSAVDVHWRLSLGRGLLPTFPEAWGSSVVVEVGGVPIRTLGPSHARTLMCFHARKDRYSSLRQLVDVVRLATLPGADLPTTPAAARLVRDVTAVASALLVDPAEPVRAAEARRWARYAPTPGAPGPRSPRDLVDDVARQLRYEPTVSTAAAVGAALLLPPPYLVSGQQPVGIPVAVARRGVGWVRHRLP